MTSGKTHDTKWKMFRWISWTSSVILLIAGELIVGYWHLDAKYGVIVYVYPLLLALGNMLGYYIGRYVTPDLDDPNVTYNESLAKKHFGIVIGTLFQTYWTMYSVIPHRDEWSHTYILSSIFRWAYQFLPVFIYLPPLPVWMLLVGCLVGMIESDSVHIWYDLNYQEKNGRLYKRR